MLSINTIVVPQGAEYQAVCRGLAQAKIKNVRVVPIPIGVKQIERVLSEHCEIIDNSSGILIMGLCGSLSNLCAIGDALLVESCKDVNYNLIKLNALLTAEIGEKLAIKTVAALTSDRVITLAQEKLNLARQYSADLVEMEGYSYVVELQNQDKAVAMLRVVSDDSYSDIPDLNRAIDPQGNLKSLPMAIALIEQPLAAVRLIKGSFAGLKALEQITAKLFSV